jgi:oligoribonuclease NrnB/cAMP/cGMP phosphodiesterase (DHH superfamily)
MICIYHSRDLDGWMSAAIVKLWLPKTELIGWDYGQPIPDLSFKEVIMVDVSFPPEIMDENKNRLTWIDHHNSAILDCQHININGLRDSKFAACELTWKFFFKDKPMPELVRLLGRYDCFGHKGTEEEQKVLEVQYGARAIISNPHEAYKELVDNISCDNTELQIWSIGRGIYKYLCAEAQQTYARRFEITLDGYKFGCVNECRFNPINFGIDYHLDGYDGFACFHYQNGQWVYSVYNDNGKTDCSIIAKNRGGGGHKGASGFRSKEVIF